MTAILVTGGAGYIGSHCVRELLAQGFEPIVLDDLSRGHAAAVPKHVPLYSLNLHDAPAITALLQKHAIHTVMHCAAYAYVDESVRDPMRYYANNLEGSLHLLNALLEANVKRIIFSSSCVVYGTPKQLPITEDMPLNPISPYGESKAFFEKILQAHAKAHALSYVTLRYFNAAGAHPDGTLGEDHIPETRLIPLAIRAAMGQNPALHIYGTDYPTPDGTCQRDYVHVVDIARAHLLALHKLQTPGQYTYNLALGQPYSVREVIAAVERVTGLKVPTKELPPRPGDPATLYASPNKAMSELGWQPTYTNLEDIVRTAWHWHRQHPKGFKP